MSKSNRPAGAVAAKRRSLASLSRRRRRSRGGRDADDRRRSAFPRRRRRTWRRRRSPGPPSSGETLTASARLVDRDGHRSRSRSRGSAATPPARTARPIAGATGQTYVAVGGRRRLDAARRGHGDERRGLRERPLGADRSRRSRRRLPVNTAEPAHLGVAGRGDDAQRPRPARGPARRSRTRTSGCAATRAAGSPTARTARRSPGRRAPATRSRPTTSGAGSASR